ncbi:uncharacterized protein LOC111398409 [Olea europaea var. sylvestris]|uniref:uncharacterized protein LOC111398409 n=1 Tax=Olea europaea var. sylvestris TaxID=158386 RepID=UPI000C1CDCAF|nr:uncharacterized protein LOC111398409 [Olea europaea var. sylvestris]
MVQDMVKAVEKIKRRLKTTQDRQRSYADERQRPLEFEIGDNVCIKISPIKGLLRFGKSLNILLTKTPTDIHLDLTWEEKPIRILMNDTKKLRKKEIPIVRVLWQSNAIEEETWEREDEIKAQYPELFD